MESRIPEIDRSLPDEEQARILRDALDWMERLAHDAEQGVSLSPEEAKRLRSYSKEAGPAVRRLAVEFLIHFYNGPVDWEDFKAWCLDPDGDVRSMAMDAVDWRSRPLGRLCLSDTERCASIMVESVTQYTGGIFELRQLVHDSDEWLEAVWPHIGPLLDQNRPELFTAITSRFLVEVIRSRDWGPDNPHIREWIDSDKTNRKMALLAVALSLWPVEGRLRKIVEALTNDQDPVIAQIAKVTLREDTGRMELTLGHYDIVREGMRGE